MQIQKQDRHNNKLTSTLVFVKQSAEYDKSLTKTLNNLKF